VSVVDICADKNKKLLFRKDAQLMKNIPSTYSGTASLQKSYGFYPRKLGSMPSLFYKMEVVMSNYK